MKPSLNSYHVPKFKQVQGGEEMPNNIHKTTFSKIHFLHTYKNNNSLFFVLINPKKNSLNA
jgi:hypothetical protein